MKKQKTDIGASDRKKDHIRLAFESNIGVERVDSRFFYEPALNTTESEKGTIALQFLDARLEAPIWVSSMTGGTEIAYKVNHNLARVCHEFGLGMGLGSCRQLLYSDEFFADFDVRETIGLQPLLANLGIAQVIEVIKKEEYLKVDQLISNLRADGLIIHINPLQEWLQPEGDKITMNPIKAIEKIVENCNFPILVKEVGQGFGPASLKALLEMDIAGIELAGFGGTNFAMLETLRSEESMHSHLTRVGHSAEEMVEFLNELSLSNISYLEKHIIISGGIKDYLTGYYLNELCNFPSVYGQASQFLKYALEDYAVLARYVEEQIKGYKIAKQFLKIRK